MRFYIVSIFPELIESFRKTSLIKKAQEREAINIEIVNPRHFAAPPHYQVDDVPYGGGAGMVLKPEPLVAAVEDIKTRAPQAKVIALTPAGRLFTQCRAQELAAYSDIVLICGRYEGIDQRVTDLVVDEEISIGDYILMGGEVAAMAVTEAISRLQPNVVGNTLSTACESFGSDGLLEAPHYTRPPEFRGLRVPDVLTSGDHKKIADWRREQGLLRTQRHRPDLISPSRNK
jgi:tRNA (guanine37-N1)-methyltransferase